MLERYYVRPDTVDRVRSSWIGGPVERYVEWLAENGYSSRTVLRRIPLLMEFGEVARQQGATKFEELPRYIEGFTLHWFKKHGRGCNPRNAHMTSNTSARLAPLPSLSLAKRDHLA